MKAVILARVSTKDQEEFGHSLPAQLKKLHEYAHKHQIEVVKEFSFSESAGTKIRKKFEEVLHYLRTHDDVKALLCQNVDRATRNFKDAVDLDEMRINQGLEIHFVQEGFVLSARSSGNEMFMWEAKVFIAKQYLNRLKDDATRSQNYKIQNGEWIARAPIGYLNIDDQATGKKTIVIDKERAFLVRRLFDEYATGGYSLQEITLKAKQWGLTSNGKVSRPFGRSHIHRILSNRFYCGWMLFRDKTTRHRYETIVDELLFQKCQDVMHAANRKRFKYSEYAGKSFIFRGLIKCAECGCSFSSDRKKNRYTYLRPTHSKGPCDCREIREEAVLEEIQKILKGMSIPQNLFEGIKEQLQQSFETKKAFHEQSIQHLRKEYDTNQRSLNVLLDLRIRESITQDEYDKKALELKQRQHELDRLLSNHTKADEEFNITVSALLDLVSRAYELFESSEVEQKRKLINFVFTNLQIRKKKLEFSMRKPFDAFLNLPQSQKRRLLGDKLRTDYYSDILSLYPLLPALQDLLKQAA